MLLILSKNRLKDNFVISEVDSVAEACFKAILEHDKRYIAIIETDGGGNVLDNGVITNDDCELTEIEEFVRQLRLEVSKNLVREML